jgi:hypothetical protein
VPPREHHASRERDRAVVVEPHPVHERPVLHQPEEARPGVARLRLGRDGPDLGESEAQRLPPSQRDGVLVPAGRQPDAGAEPQAHQLHPRTAPSRDAAGHAQQRPPERVLAGDAQGVHRQPMDALRIEAEEQRAQRRERQGTPAAHSS